MRAKNKIFHLECFRCVACEKQLVPGDEFALRDDGLFCREDHQDNDRKDSIENNNTIQLHHNASNSSEDNSEGMYFIGKAKKGSLYNLYKIVQQSF